MSGSIIGNILKLSTFGESHGPAIGGVIDGFPSGCVIDQDAVQKALDRRRPGQSSIVTQRKEGDKVRFLSGIFDGVTTGCPIGFIIENNDQKSSDYDHIKKSFRPSHADYTYYKKYGIRDYRGGGRSSARETACRVVAGELAKHILPNLEIKAYVSSVGNIELGKEYWELDLDKIDSNIVRCPDLEMASKMESYIKEVRKDGDTVGGIVDCVIKNAPIGLGEPVFDKLHANLGKAMLSINAVKGFEYGSGFAGTRQRGSEHNDLFNQDGTTVTNNSGGIQGGISNGMDIYFRVAFKPVATIMKSQQSFDLDNSSSVVDGKGRHDPCVVPRAVPIVESMAALVIADFYLISKSAKIN